MADKLRAVLVGCGDISDVWLKALAAMDQVDLIALVDLNKSIAEAQAVAYELDNIIVDADLEAVLSQTRPDIVFDCTVPAAHADVTMLALQYGCHVLGEKPMADSIEAAHRMIAAAREAGRVYAVMQNRRFDPNIRRLQAFLASGEIGKLTTINSDFYIGAHMGGFRYHMPHVLLLDMAIHTFDAARFLTEADPVSVYCKEWNPHGSWFDRDASAMAIFEMSSGLIYSYRGSWAGEGLRTTWESDWRVLGSKGSARWDGATAMEAEIGTEVPGYYADLEEVKIPKGTSGITDPGHPALIQDFVTCIQTGQTPGTVCTDNIKSLAMVFSAIESAEQGKPVAVRW